MDESEDPIAGGKRIYLITMINKTNKNYPVGEKQTGRLDKVRQGRAGQGRAGQGRTQDIDDPTYGNEPIT